METAEVLIPGSEVPDLGEKPECDPLFEIAQAEASLKQAQHPASEKSEPLRILAPVDGYVLNVYEASARVITPGMPIMEVGDLQDLEAEIELLSNH
jgi:HlyD family secretion protein